eukprot:5159821-Pleurochrysis_carterae.AAC.2
MTQSTPKTWVAESRNTACVEGFGNEGAGTHSWLRRAGCDAHRHRGRGHEQQDQHCHRELARPGDDDLASARYNGDD